MKSLSVTTSDRVALSLVPHFGRWHGSVTALHQPCCEHFVADAAWSTSTPPADTHRATSAALTP